LGADEMQEVVEKKVEEVGLLVFLAMVSNSGVMRRRYSSDPDLLE